MRKTAGKFARKFNNPDNQNQWLNHGQMAEPVAKRDWFSRKTLLCIWWNFEGVIHYELFPNNRTTDVNLYYTQLGRMYVKLSRKYPTWVNRKRLLLQQDNAKPHTTRRTKEKIKELEEIELLPHPAYRPDIVPFYYHLFSQWFNNKRFNNLEQVEAVCL